MARLVKKENKAPLEIKVGRKSIRICMCGLGNNQPFCDESHKKTADEEDDKIYVYKNEDNNKVEVKNWEECYNDA